MQKNNPILINVPHSSTYIPPEEIEYFTTPYLQHYEYIVKIIFVCRYTHTSIFEKYGLDLCV